MRVRLALLAVAIALATPVFAQDDSPDGAQLYYVHGCYGCHGFDGKSRIRPLDTATSPILASEEVFLTFLRMRADQNPILPSTAMPNYPAESLPDDDARAIYAHIVSIQTDDPAVEDVPALQTLLDATSGE